MLGVTLRPRAETTRATPQLESPDRHSLRTLTKPVDYNEFLKVVMAIEDFWLTVVRLPHRPLGR